MPTGGFNSDWNKLFLDLVRCAEPGFFFLAGFSREYHYSVAHVPTLRVCSCQIDSKANENIGLDLKIATNLENASV